MTFDQGVLADSLSETAGYKAGLALSVEELCDALSGTSYPDTIRASEEYVVRLRSEEYEALFYKLLHRIGYTAEEYDGDVTGAKYFHKYRDTALEQWTGVTKLYVRMWPKMMKAAHEAKTKQMDPRPFIMAAYKKYGQLGVTMAMERIEALNKAVTLSPHSLIRYRKWHSPIALAALFKGSKEAPELGRFIDQRYIDFLSQNEDKLALMHWRKFEQLTAEFFDREGYSVELGPGSNDEGVDVRVWKPGDEVTENPHCLIQCKRQKDKVEKVVVKGLMADVQFEGADLGLVVTTSELSPGSRSTIAARSYPIKEIDKNGLSRWLQKLRTPGTGIVRV
ncbi:restriction endonuclease [Paucibacter sp. PLA-PC-4]|uniref:restriction endonuclease n=1 Tax=Paucibacter sp. PLA-PC-4 TaxID=2993655 RepID=UPI00224A4E92|nr:restriction endonuclease [Paucibacter sp. PLA-PC-4]MCX2865532.1 restriction endonuclease [Paucibacter sp. PLA-PC-4]